MMNCCGGYGLSFGGCRSGCCCGAPIVPVVVIYTLGGLVTGTDGLPAAGVPIQYTLNGLSFTTVTGADGRYTIPAPHGAAVTITPTPGIGVTVTPPFRALTASMNRADLDFALSAV